MFYINREDLSLILVSIISLVVNQNYMTEATNEYVIMGNSALMRCVIPSFVSDFISLQNWQDEKGNIMVADNNNYGRQQIKSKSMIRFIINGNEF